MAEIYEDIVKFFHRTLKVHIQMQNGVKTYRTAYSYRSHFMSSRLKNGMKVYNLARLCGTSVEMIAKHYDLNVNLEHREEITKHLKYERQQSDYDHHD